MITVSPAKWLQEGDIIIVGEIERRVVDVPDNWPIDEEIAMNIGSVPAHNWTGDYSNRIDDDYLPNDTVLVKGE